MGLKVHSRISDQHGSGIMTFYFRGPAQTYHHRSEKEEPPVKRKRMMAMAKTQGSYLHCHILYLSTFYVALLVFPTRCLRENTCVGGNAVPWAVGSSSCPGYAEKP